MPSSQQIQVIIIGGGTFGTTTAYHLSQTDYKKVVVLDRFKGTPSPEAAGTDINKVIRTEYPDQLYTKLASDARDIWKDPNGLFSGLYHESGWVIGASERSMPFVESSIVSAKKMGVEPVHTLSVDDVKNRWPRAFGNGRFDGWKLYYSPHAAWVNAREGMRRMARKSMDSNVVEYITGESGHVVQLLFNANSTCIGVKCIDGSTYFADKIVLAAGAAAAELLDLEGQIEANGHTVGHIQLTPEEVEKYKNMPIVDHLEGGE